MFAIFVLSMKAGFSYPPYNESKSCVLYKLDTIVFARFCEHGNEPLGSEKGGKFMISRATVNFSIKKVFHSPPFMEPKS
jgi:hypothetical protein